MTSTVRKILDEALDLTEEERRLVGETLLGSVAAEIDLGPAWKTEIAQRLARLESGDAELLDARDHLRSVRDKLAP